MRWLDIIPQSTLQGRGILQGQEDKGCTSNNGVGQLSIMQNKNEMDDEVLYINGLTWDNSASSIMKRDDKALYNNQLDEELGLYEDEQYAKFWTTRLSTINLMRTRDL